MNTITLPAGTTLKLNGFPLHLKDDTEVEMSEANYKLSTESTETVEEQKGPFSITASFDDSVGFADVPINENFRLFLAGLSEDDLRRVLRRSWDQVSPN